MENIGSTRVHSFVGQSRGRDLISYMLVVFLLGRIPAVIQSHDYLSRGGSVSEARREKKSRGRRGHNKK